MWKVTFLNPFYLCQFIFFHLKFLWTHFLVWFYYFSHLLRINCSILGNWKMSFLYLFKRYKNEFIYPYFVWKENNRNSLLYILKLKSLYHSYLGWQVSYTCLRHRCFFTCLMISQKHHNEMIIASHQETTIRKIIWHRCVLL